MFARVLFGSRKLEGLRIGVFSESVFIFCALSHGHFPQLGRKDRRMRRGPVVSGRFDSLPNEAISVLELEFDAHLSVSGLAGTERTPGQRLAARLFAEPRAKSDRLEMR